MATSKFTIKNTDVLKFILKEFNENSFNDKITFSIAQWMATQNENGLDSLLIQRLALNNNDGLDVVETFNDNTYTYGSKAFVPMNIATFNADPTAVPQDDFKEVVFDTNIDFLVFMDDIAIQEVITLAIEEIKTKLIQKLTTYEVSFLDIENRNNPERIKESFKVLTMTDSLEYGNVIEINGVNYITYHLGMTIYFVNKAEFTNQQKFKLGVESITQDGNVKMFDITPYLIEWHWGQITSHNTTQLLNEMALSNQDNASETVSKPMNTTYAIAFDLQMDFQNELLRKLYRDSKEAKKGNGKELYYLIDETEEYDLITKQFVVNDDMRFVRQLYRGINQPSTDLSKGQKMVWSLTFTPSYIEDK